MTLLFDLDEDQEEEDLTDDKIDTDEGTNEETISIEEFKKFQADKEKGVQKLIIKQKAMDFAVDNLDKVADNPEHLLVVAEQNRQSADYILKKYYGGITMEEYKKTILKTQKDVGEKEITEDTIRSKVQQEFEQRDINKYLKEFKKNISHHDEDVQEKILAEYEDYIDGKTNVDAEKSKKYMYRAYQDIIGSKFDETRNVASMMGIGGTQKSGSKKSDTEEAVSEFKSFMTSTIGRTFRSDKK